MDRRHLVLIVAFLAGPSALAQDAPAPTDALPALADLGWMAGSWRGTLARGDYEEHWMAPAGGTILGMGRAVRGDRTVFTETLRIEQREDGVYYVVSPEGQPTATFKLTAGTKTSADFTNPEHGRPHTIAYRLCPDGNIAARVTSLVDGKDRAMDVPFVRDALPGRPPGLRMGPGPGGDAARYCVATYAPGPAHDAAKPVAEQAGMDGHARHLATLAKAGTLVAGGPLSEPGGLLVILGTADADEARRLAEADPVVASGVFTVTIRPWLAAAAAVR